MKLDPEESLRRVHLGITILKTLKLIRIWKMNNKKVCKITSPGKILLSNSLLNIELLRSNILC